MHTSFKLLAALLCIGLFAGCTTTYRMKVDALAAPGAREMAVFTIEEPSGEFAGSRLRYREAARFVSEALISRGWRQAADPAEADLIVSLTAEVSEPLTETEIRSEPIYYRTWGRTSYVRTPVFDSAGKVKGVVVTPIYYPPETRFGGYSDYPRNVTVYEKSLELTARDRAGEEQWTVTVETVDESSDLRRYIPILAAAAMPYVAETTDGTVLVRLKEDSETVQYLRENVRS
ncbi:MAG: hypothetical protein ACLFR7_08240 [Opitutales bacterium]